MVPLEVQLKGPAKAGLYVRNVRWMLRTERSG
jgi:hypothetical protein